MGDVYMLNGKILSGLPNHAKDIEFDNTGTTLSSTNTEDAIKEIDSNLSKHTMGTAIPLISGTPYTAPTDGYLILTVPANTSAIATIDSVRIYDARNTTANGQSHSFFVRKGSVLGFAADSANFYPLV